MLIQLEEGELSEGIINIVLGTHVIVEGFKFLKGETLDGALYGTYKFFATVFVIYSKSSVVGHRCMMADV